MGVKNTSRNSKQNPQASPNDFSPDNQPHQGESGGGFISWIKQLGEKIVKSKCDDNEKWVSNNYHILS
jgi:hypothetical protein